MGGITMIWKALSVEEIRKFQCVKDWLSGVKRQRTGSDKTAENYLRNFTEYVNHRQKTPDELLKEDVPYREGKKITVAEYNVDQYFTWLQDKKEGPIKRRGKGRGLGRGSAKTIYGTLRSFFRQNEVVFYSKTPQAIVETKPLQISDETLRKMWKQATLEEKLPLAFARSTGWRPEDMLALTYGDVKQDLESGESRIYIEKVTAKEDLWAAVFYTEEATEILRLAIENRKKKGEVFTDGTKILPYKYGQLLQYFTQAGKRIDVRLSPKFFRKWFRTKCSPIIGKDAVFRMAAWTLPGVGKHYDLPDRNETLERFIRIEQLLTFEPKAVSDKEQQIQNLINFAIAQGLQPIKAEELRRVFKSEALTPEQAAERLREELVKEKPETATDRDCLDGQHCQKIVSEDELPKMLAQGWKAVMVCPSGKVVVER